MLIEERYHAWILLLRDETLVQGTKYLASHFCCFSRAMLHRNLEYLRILWCAESPRKNILIYTYQNATRDELYEYEWFRVLQKELG